MQRLVLAFLLLGITPAAASDLSLKRVMLSSAGVGYFEFETEVDGPAALGLDVPLDQVDDVLTSLVVFDSTGAVGTVELPGRDNTRANLSDYITRYWKERVLREHARGRFFRYLNQRRRADPAEVIPRQSQPATA